ncbi:DnaJ domain protein [Rasamsonia emersonii CBS 393.64]|uniref:DnaJ domain protein n=1 Tax=Rasamsonia emersonii (strain ATCC 16479 / CBS 393.64 / IMI 116815) TaxID=1408163 RepID=A0A0F4YP40_RASE3|nr:DnaJ domain protein [Rasamsonia emersonii CBS 393.64]KKA20014.1 DnaJ domain protein [Rasamsonia emersonii CBS 393.64]
MPSRDEDLADEPPSAINPYEVLGVDEKATADEIKTAYRKKALKHHPDKAPPDAKDEANQKFQEIAFAYAILSDERRRRRYDLTGSTSETLDLEDDDFNWMEFYREQFSSMVDRSAIEKIKKEYQGSDEERRDLLAAFEKYKGDMDKVYEVVMLSNVLDDDERFRAIINKAIADGEVKGWKNYTEEPEAKRQRRLKRAQEEAKEAEELAKELDKEEKGPGAKGRKKKAAAKADDNELAALIQQRQKARAANFFDELEAKYAQPKKGKKRAPPEEPPEEAFEAVAARKTANKEKDSKSAGRKSKRTKS